MYTCLTERFQIPVSAHIIPAWHCSAVYLSLYDCDLVTTADSIKLKRYFALLRSGVFCDGEAGNTLYAFRSVMMDLKLRLKARVHGCCARSVLSDSRATTWVLTLYVSETPFSSDCLAGLLKTVNKDSFEVCLLAIMAKVCAIRCVRTEAPAHWDSQMESLSTLQTEQEVNCLLWLLTWLLQLAMLKIHVARSLWTYKLAASYHNSAFRRLVGEVRKRTVVGESLHIRHWPAAGRQQDSRPSRVSHTG